MKILVACEESQTVTKFFRERGHEAFSCDIEPCSGGHPEWHMQGDVTPILSEKWDMVIAFPPCTHLAVSGAAWFEQKRKDGRQQRGIDFFLQFARIKHIGKVAIENPIGIMSKIYRKPDQVIHPYYFGDPFSKSTCLWLNGLPRLFHAKEEDLFNKTITHTDKGESITYSSGVKMPKWYADAYKLPPKERAAIRSKTFPGIAKAMAEQWG